MTSPAPAVSVSHPPFIVLHLMNQVLEGLLRSPVGASLSRRYVTLSFTGRKSRQAYDFPIRPHWLDGDLYAVTSNRWLLNFRGGAPVRITFDGRTTEHHGELIESPETVAELLTQLTTGYGPTRAQHKLALKFRTAGTPSRDDFIAAVRNEKIAAIRFTAV
ncbi:hypothetical protein [Streptomyces justiciae]|uniref:hypothetical protein n=1 Tax=Streptomyces justiciae TaxID=2780140 RepID=UPI00211947C0|nr:hypothetical protein [Streptomyces justiciae]MCW8378677.1 hypothetical protein [Streptomyces justiciae]